MRHYDSYRPSLLDHLPKTRRGHGTTHPNERRDRKTGRLLRAAVPCVVATCGRNLPVNKDGSPRGEAHDDQEANAADWKEEHKISRDRPFAECFA